MTIPSKRTEKIWKKVKSTMQDPCALEKCVPPDICISLPLRERELPVSDGIRENRPSHVKPTEKKKKKINLIQCFF